MPLEVGLTGNIGSGKSTVAGLFVARGAALIDADVLARAATDDPAVLKAVGEAFGASIIQGSVIDRRTLAEVVFADPDARRRLNAIIHPWVAAERERRVVALVAQAEPPAIIVHDIPLLFEVGLEAEMDKTVVVDAPFTVRLARVQARSGLSEGEFHARDAAQLPLAEKVRRADYVIDNGAGEDDLEAEVSRVWAGLLEDAQKNSDP